jgi:adenosylcobinamide-GDP ribazoletransferase
VLWSAAWVGHEVAAALSVSLLAAVTGCLHLDGLADTADGFASRGDRERALRIMKDPAVGAFGIVALVLALLTKWAALRTLSSKNSVGDVIAACAFARTMLPLLCVLHPYARAEGTGAQVVRGARLWHAMLALAAASLLGLAAGGLQALALLPVCLVLGLATGGLSRRRIGGITGDVLGAACELAETCALVVACLMRHA